MKTEQTKLYYSIGEVAKIINVNNSLLRFWEKEFPKYISPKKNAKGVRMYAPEDIHYIKIIHHLLKTRGYTIKGAQQKLTSDAKATIDNAEVVMELQRLRALLADIKGEFE
ncbi:MAG: MerR family transcriptional regulator [Flavobacteriales bacterium]